MLRERLFRKKAPGFPRDRRADALDGVRIEESPRRQDAQGEDILPRGDPVGGLGAMLRRLLLWLAGSVCGPPYRDGGLSGDTTVWAGIRRLVLRTSRLPY